LTDAARASRAHRPGSFLARGRAAGIVPREALDGVDLVHDQEAIVPLDDVLDLVRLVSRREDKTVVLSPDTLVLLERQLEACLATPFGTAFAEELEQLLGGRRPRRDSLLVKPRHSFIDFARQGLVDRLSFVALLHLPPSFHSATAFVPVFEREAAGRAQPIELLEAHHYPAKAVQIDALADEGHIISGKPVRPD